MAESGSGMTAVTGRFTKPMGKKNLPIFPGIWAALGPGIVWAGLSQGSGELIWWPYMVAKYGLWFCGWLIIWAFMQLWYNQELGRYTLLTGEDFYTGAHRIHHLFGWLTLFLAILMFSWVGGYTGAAASALTAITGFPPGWDFKNQVRFWAIILIIAWLVIIFLGPVAYRIVEIVEIIAAFASFFGMLVAVCVTAEVRAVAGEFFASLFVPRLGLPPGWDVADTAVLITLIAYTGAGGIWNTGYSFWVRDKGFGQAAHIGRVTSPVTGAPEPIPSVGYGFDPTDENMKETKKWTHLLWVDNCIGVVLNLVTIFLTSMLSYGILHPAGKWPKGWSLVVVQGEWLGRVFGRAGEVLMLLLGFFFLADVWLTAGDLFSRIVSTHSYVLRETVEVKEPYKPFLALWIPIAIVLAVAAYDPKLPAGMLAGAIAVALIYSALIIGILVFAAYKGLEYRYTYYTVWVAFTIMGITQLFLKAPSTLIVSTGVMSMFVQAIFCTALLYLNWFLLPKIHPAGEKIRPHWGHFIILLGTTIVWWWLSFWYMAVKLG